MKARFWMMVFVLTGAVFAPAALVAEERIQLAILLDTSNSMDGLIGQAKSQLWRVVNELARARRNDRRPELQVALLEYGNNGISAASGYVRVVTNLTTDLDLISEKLFGLTTNGGDEYCGLAIDRAVQELSWSGSDDVLKVIYIAGNEPFTQGELRYEVADARAVRRGIVVNTIFCGDREEGISTSWRDGATRTGGRYMSIDQDAVVREIRSPWDDEIVRLGNALNETYLGYGAAGESLKERQVAQDSNAASMGAPAAVERSVAKAQGAYENQSWDLLDALEQGQVTLSSLKNDQLPLAMRTMTPAQKERYVKEMAEQREQIQAQINAANDRRRDYIAKEMESSAEQQTLDQAILGSVREEAADKGFTFE